MKNIILAITCILTTVLVLSQTAFAADAGGGRGSNPGARPPADADAGGGRGSSPGSNGQPEVEVGSGRGVNPGADPSEALVSRRDKTEADNIPPKKEPPCAYCRGNIVNMEIAAPTNSAANISGAPGATGNDARK